MITIDKYEIGITDRGSICAPEGAELLSLAQHGNALWIWARVDTDRPFVVIPINWRCAGHDCAGLGRFVGTVIIGILVFHAFRDPE